MSKLETLDDVIAALDHGIAITRPAVAFYDAVDALKSIRDSGVLVAKGSRAWAMYMHDNGIETVDANGLSVGGRGRIASGTPPFTLAPPAYVEREVPAWEACRAFHEGFDVCHEHMGKTKWANAKDRDSCACITFVTSSIKWFVRYPADKVPG